MGRKARDVVGDPRVKEVGDGITLWRRTRTGRGPMPASANWMPWNYENALADLAHGSPPPTRPSTLTPHHGVATVAAPARRAG